MLRPGGQLIFLVNSVLLMLTIPDEDGQPAVEHLLRPYFGMHRFEWPDDDSVEFHLGHGDMIRLLRRCGLEVENLVELQPPPGATRVAPPRHAGLGPQMAVRGSVDRAEALGPEEPSPGLLHRPRLRLRPPGAQEQRNPWQ